MTISEVNKELLEQSITDSCIHKNIRQFDLRAYYDEILVASLWQDEEKNWHWTKRLYDIGTVEDMETEYLDNKSLKGIIAEFLICVRDWLEDEEDYLKSIRNELDEDNSELICVCV